MPEIESTALETDKTSSCRSLDVKGEFEGNDTRKH